MSGQNDTFIHQLLNSCKCTGKILAIPNVGHFFAYFIQNLGKAGTTQFQFIEWEIDIDDLGSRIIFQYRNDNFTEIGYFADSRNDNRSRSIHFFVPIFLGHRKWVFPGRNVYSQLDSKVAGSLYRLIQPGIFSFIAAGPHPVGRKWDSFQSLFDRRPYQISQRFGNSQTWTRRSIGHGSYRSMSDGGCYPTVSAIIQRDGSNIAQRQMQRTDTLLTHDTARYRTVYLIRQPILRSNRLYL